MGAVRRLLITGATGKQGGAVISALLAHPPTNPFEIVALTRNASSARAQALARQPNVSILEGDLDDTEAIFQKTSQPFYGVFSVQVPMNAKQEEKQGRDLIDTAAAHGVRHFIYTSVDRGGPAKSDVDGSPIEHFQSKFSIENHLKAVAAKENSTMIWTIIRPVAFMENLAPGFFGKAFVAMWRLNGLDTKLQLVSVQDIGILAAEAFMCPEDYAAKAVSLATDEISPRQAEGIFRRVLGTDIPCTYLFVGTMLKLVLHKHLGVMFDWFKSEGYGADPEEYLHKYPAMQNFEKWLQTRSAFRPKALPFDDTHASKLG